MSCRPGSLASCNPFLPLGCHYCEPFVAHVWNLRRRNRLDGASCFARMPSEGLCIHSTGIWQSFFAVRLPVYGQCSGIALDNEKRKRKETETTLELENHVIVHTAQARSSASWHELDPHSRDCQDH